MFALNEILTTAARERAMPHEPINGVAPPTKRRKSPQDLAPEQAYTLVASADEGHCLPHARAAHLHGLRRSEVVALRVQHLNKLRKRISAEENSVLVKGVHEIGTPMSGPARIIPLPRTS